MSRMDILRIMRDYEAGRITKMETIICLCDLAVDLEPSQITLTIPAEFFTELRELANSGNGPHRLTRGDEQRFNLGLNKWREYFAMEDSNKAITDS